MVEVAGGVILALIVLGALAALAIGLVTITIDLRRGFGVGGGGCLVLAGLLVLIPFACAST